MKLEKDTLILSVQNPNYIIFALSYKQSILQLIYRFNTELKLSFRLLTRDVSSCEISNFLHQIYFSKGIICDEKLFLFENRQDKTYIVPAYKASKYILIVIDKGILNKDIYTDKIAGIIGIQAIQAISECKILKMRKGVLYSILTNLD